MTTRRKIFGPYVEVKRIVDGEVKQTMCRCPAPGRTARDCSNAAGNKSRCRCECHKGRTGPGDRK